MTTNTVSNLVQIRIANARAAFEQAGGVGSVAKKMGYSGASFLVQMFGPKPTRTPTEKTMRRIEESLGLPAMSLDSPDGPAKVGTSLAAPAPSDKGGLDTAALSRVISLVNKLIEEEKVDVGSDKFAALVSMAYEDAVEQGGVAREAKMRQVLQLLN
ncbi:hypothetical protein ACCQ08_25485 [Comamonas sp. SY3]|uniref:hypothetical protein n=1 Tax=Comamonas sp. SY3 TaxID=3243601 RepID=UPI003593B7FB